MPREKHKKHHQPGEHIWEPMKEYEIATTDDFLEEVEGGIEGKINLLRKIEPNNYLVVMTLPSYETDTQPFLNYIERLKDYGLNIDKSDIAEYGYKMPEAEKGKKERELRIFRREIIRKEKEFRRK